LSALVDGWRRLGNRVAAERARRRWTVDELAEAAQLSRRTIRSIESAERDRYRPTTLGKLEGALGWVDGSVDRIVEGRSPRREPDPLLARLLDGWPQLSADQQVVIVALVEVLNRQH
jgi:transcriptional regulator with XRE-family HTH domain